MQSDEILDRREIDPSAETGRGERVDRDRLEVVRLGKEPTRGCIAPSELLLVVTTEDDRLHWLVGVILFAVGQK